MLYLILFYLIATAVCFVTGVLFYKAISTCYSGQAIERPFIVVALSGLMLLTGIGQLLVLFLPLTPLVSLCVLAGILLLAVLFGRLVVDALKFHAYKFSKKPVWAIIGLVGMVFMTIVLNAGPTMMDDTESYHIQMIKWIQEYGTVPGLANLHLRYGFNSSWFTSIGLLAPASGSINHFLALNGLISCWACIYFFNKISSNLPTHFSPGYKMMLATLVCLLFALLVWPMIRGNANTCNYDFITTLCVLILFIETLYAKPFTLQGEWIIWPCYLFTVRIINFPLLLLTLPILWSAVTQKKWRSSFAIIGSFAFLIVPFLIRNVILSGYLLFPSRAFDVFSFDWKADQQMTVNIVEYIRYYNRVNVAFQGISTTRAIPFPDWLLSWFHFQVWYNKLLLISSFLCFGLSLVKWKLLRDKISLMAIYALLVIGAVLLSWFIIAPDPRFVYGAFLCGIFLAFQLLPDQYFTVKMATASRFIFVALGLICGAYASFKLYSLPNYRNFATPYPLAQPPTQKILIDHINMYIPEKILDNWNARCFGSPLPCLYRVHPGLKARGTTISEGFYIDSNVKAVFKPGDWY